MRLDPDIIELAGCMLRLVCLRTSMRMHFCSCAFSQLHARLAGADVGVAGGHGSKCVEGLERSSGGELQQLQQQLKSH